MKIKFKPINFILLFGSLMFIDYKLASVGVPNAYIYIFAALYGLLFPLRCIIVEPIDGDKKPDETT